MIETINIYQYDPTRTTVLRNAFAREMRKRFTLIKTVISKSIVDKNCFGVYQVTPTQSQQFAFGRSQDKIAGFMRWLDDQVKEGVLEVGTFQQAGGSIEQAWTNKYISDSYKRGVQRARYELDKAGYNVPSIEQTGGIEISMATPFHIDRLGLLYTRTFNDLKNITDAMSGQIARILTQGIADGDNPRLLARKLVATIDGKGMGELGITDILGRFIPARRRAEMLARTEIIRAHHQATIQEYKNWGVEGTIVKAEWMTAGDNRVCNQCADLQGSVYTLDEIEKMIPYHPGCRCVALPYKSEEILEIKEKEVIEKEIKAIDTSDYFKGKMNFGKYGELIYDKNYDEVVKFYNKQNEKVYNNLNTITKRKILNSIKEYTIEGEYKNGNYRAIRDYLTDKDEFIRLNNLKSAEYQVNINKLDERINNISKFISNNKLDENIILNRGINTETCSFFNNLKKGDIYIDKSFVSSNMVEISSWGDLNIEIIVSKGKEIACAMSSSPLEYEFLIQKNSKFKVINKKKNKLIVELL